MSGSKRNGPAGTAPNADVTKQETGVHAAAKFTFKPLATWSQRAAIALFNRRTKATIDRCLFGSTPEKREKFLALLPELLEHCIEFCRTCETLLVQTIPDGDLNYDEAKQIALHTVRLDETAQEAPAV